MATNSLRFRPALSTPYLCLRCSLQPSRRWLHSPSHSQTPLQSETPSQPDTPLQSQTPWGAQQSMLETLEKRGYINQIAGTRDELETLMQRKGVGAYVGIDPTASSMHVGHLIPFMSLFWMYLHGAKAVTLLGGATAGVGDPTGRSTARTQQSKPTRLANTDAIGVQIQRLWTNVAALAEKHMAKLPPEMQKNALILNNEDWLQETSIMEILGVIGSGLRLGPLLGRDTVKNRMESSDGMSFAEFCYPVLQAWDWLHMFSTHRIQVQIGGADQYGNILSGMDAIKHATKTKYYKRQAGKTRLPLLSAPIGFTVPLLTTPSGEKFGKSAGNAVWLDQEQTSVFDLYGFFVSQPDADVERLLKFFTFIPLPTIEEIMAEHIKSPEKRIAQHKLAREFVELVHGPEQAANAEWQHTSMFSRSAPKLEEILKGQPDVILPVSKVIGQAFSSVLYSAGLAKSKSGGTRLIQSKGAYLLLLNESDLESANKSPSFTQIDEATNHLVLEEHVLRRADSPRRTMVFRTGKRKVVVVDIMSDDEFLEAGLVVVGDDGPPVPRPGNV